MKKNNKLHCLSLIGASLATLFLSTAIAAPPSDLPEQAQAKVNVAPHKAFKLQYGNLQALVQPLYTTVNDPADYIISAGGIYDGVAKLFLTLSDGDFGCSGALLSSGVHVLTAAHCLSDEAGNNIFISGSATFDGDEGIQVKSISEIHIHPDWDGDIMRGNDIAIVTLESELSNDITRYDIDRNKDDDLAVIEKIGFGLFGMGDTGAGGSFGTKRAGQNQYDAYADTMLKAFGFRSKRDFVPGSVLQYDFDNGNSNNDAFGFFFGKSDTGLGSDEIMSAPGDSGGPSQKMGKITGVTSYGMTLNYTNGTTSDITPNLFDSSFGEFGADTRVSKYASWIDSILSSGFIDDGSTNTGSKCSPGKRNRGLC